MEVKYQVFVSSTYEDLKEERQEIINTILEMEHIPVSMEYFSAANVDQWTLIKGLLDQCDYYIVIVGGLYGSIEEVSNKSYTRLEYEYALSKGIPVIGFLRKDIESLPPRLREHKEERKTQLELFSKLVKKKICRFWESPHELAKITAISLNKLIISHPRQGWVRTPLKKPDSDVILPHQEANVIKPPKKLNVLTSAVFKETDYKSAMNMALLSFGGFVELYFVVEGLYSQSSKIETLPNSYLTPIRKGDVPPHLQQINELWKRGYQSIHKFISIKRMCENRVELKKISSLCDVYVSYLYFNLTELWGDVPYVDRQMDISETIHMGRTALDKIKGNSINNLRQVLEDNVISPQETDLALSLLAKWEMRSKNYGEAKKYLNDLINKEKYTLAPLEEIFSTNTESIANFDTEREREIFNSVDFRTLCKKGRYVHYMRYTEIFLMASEVDFYLEDYGSALESINSVKLRNKRPALSGKEDDFILSLLDEWKFNLGMEGSYFGAIKRNDYVGKLIGIPHFKVHIPIPMQELLLNPNLTQNAGY